MYTPDVVLSTKTKITPIHASPLSVHLRAYQLARAREGGLLVSHPKSIELAMCLYLYYRFVTKASMCLERAAWSNQTVWQ